MLLTRKDDDQAARLERARAIGLFRYMLIREAADPSLTGRQRGAMVRAIAAVPHTDPEGRTVRFTRWTLDRWIQDWRKGGFDALVPSPRQSQPRTPPEVFELATRAEEGEPGPVRRAGQADPGGPARLGAGRADPAADVRPHRADRAAGPGRAGGLRPVRSGQP